MWLVSTFLFQILHFDATNYCEHSNKLKPTTHKSRFIAAQEECSQVIQNRYNPSMVIGKLSSITTTAHKDHVSIIILLFYCTAKNSTAKRHTLYDKCPSVHRINSPCTLVPHITVVAATATNRGNGIWDTKRIALDLPIYECSRGRV